MCFFRHVPTLYVIILMLQNHHTQLETILTTNTCDDRTVLVISSQAVKNVLKIGNDEKTDVIKQ